ncbi:MAG: Gmad2 immunoglobulin-like domain-containing protein [Parcubacteria group bacterium]|nr:Gmad2 immunoglobulin-like domain-containing protein [Parcubacteria group bacterium]
MKRIFYIVVIMAIISLVVFAGLRFIYHEDASIVEDGNNYPKSISSSGNIIIISPHSNQFVISPLTIKGEARVFESVFQYRVKDEDGTILAEDRAMSGAPDVGQFGLFELHISIFPKGRRGIIEVFDYSAKDGSEIDKVSISVRFR